jgi:D-alanyl-D-alanine carboxypeptidase/D-alanyl-D-alanine-endopeptidase (penicillin-binding protein 4)
VSRRKQLGFVLVALVTATAAALCFAGVRPAAARAASQVAPPARTSFWSARRIPGVFAEAVAAAAQARAGAALVTRLTPILAPFQVCVAVRGQAGPLANINATLPLAPASTLKLLTATTAIDRIGAGNSLTTRALTDSSGHLIVVGGGDPRLATPDYITRQRTQARFRDAPFTPLADLADAIVAAGVHSVTGALLVDDHLHDSLRYLPDWKPVYGQEGDIGSLGALSVNGGFEAPEFATPAADPALTTGQALASLLAARGVTVAGGVRHGLAPAEAHQIAKVESPPLSAIIGEMLTNSDNYTAETLLRDLAEGSDGGAPATTETGTKVVIQEMTNLGVRTDGLVLHDGSGLAPDDRVTCAALLSIIELASTPKFAAIDKGLPIAAQTGTLAARFGGGPLAGKLRAKTGSLAGVVGLVGVIDGPADLHFAFLANGDFSSGTGAQLQAEVADALGSTPEPTVPPDLVPAP